MTEVSREICSKECKALCCRYTSLNFKAPRESDLDMYAWAVSHEMVSIAVPDDPQGKWEILILTPCEHITKDNTCAIYDDRPGVCREYPDEDGCEHPEPDDSGTVITNWEEWQAYVAERKAAGTFPETAKGVKDVGRGTESEDEGGA